MFFDTPIFFVFLTVVVLVYWVLSWKAQNRFLLVASYFFYGWWDWRFLVLITDLDFRRLSLRSLHRSIRESAASPHLADALPGRQPGLLGILQVLQFLPGFLDSPLADGRGFIRQPDCPLDPSAPRHFLLHVSGSRLHRRCLHRRLEPADSLRRLCAFHQPVPAPDRRPDPAPFPSAAASAERAAI